MSTRRGALVLRLKFLKNQNLCKKQISVYHIRIPKIKNIKIEYVSIINTLFKLVKIVLHSLKISLLAIYLIHPLECIIAVALILFSLKVCI
jgi:hypothetical protein